MSKITPREDLIETIEFNYHQGRHDFNADFWHSFIDAIESPLESKLDAANERVRAVNRYNDELMAIIDDCDGDCLYYEEDEIQE